MTIDQINQIVWACGVSDSSKPWIAKSKDKGDSWETIFLELGLLNNTYYQIVIHPQNPETMYLGTINSVLKTVDGGKIWRIMLHEPSTLFINLAIDLSNPKHIYAGGYFYLWESYDGGETWQRIAGRGIIKKLVTVPDNPNVLYFATENGVWRYESLPKLISDDAITLTLELQESIKLDTALALEIDDVLNAARTQYDNLKSIHTHPSYVPTQLGISSIASWTQAWRDFKVITGNSAIDSLSAIYKLLFAEYQWGSWYLLNFAQPLKKPLLASLYQSIPGIIHAEPNYYGIRDQVDVIILFKKNDIWHIVFIDAPQDGPIGDDTYWYLTVDKNLVAEFIAEQKYGLESVPRIYLWNIPAIYCATVFKNGDEIFFSALFSNDWWVRRHAVEVIGQLYTYYNPRELADKNNSSLYEQLRDEMRSKQQEAIVVLTQLLNDPDQDVQALAQWALQKVLDYNPNRSDYYFPLEKNNKWTFSYAIFETITDMIRLDDSLYFRFDRFREFTDILMRMTFDKKLMLRENSSEQVWLNFSANIGDSWKVNTPNGNSGWTVHLQSKTDTIKVPIGTFTNCYRFWFQFNGTDNDWVEWYAPGVGPVKRIHYGFGIREYLLVHASVKGFYPPTNVEQPTENKLPDKFYLYPNYPNPFNTITAIPFDLPYSSYVALEIYNIIGKMVRTLVADQKPAGYFEVQWNGMDELNRAVASGIYFCRLKAIRPSREVAIQVRKLMLVR